MAAFNLSLGKVKIEGGLTETVMCLNGGNRCVIYLKLRYAELVTDQSVKFHGYIL